MEIVLGARSRPWIHPLPRRPHPTRNTQQPHRAWLPAKGASHASTSWVTLQQGTWNCVTRVCTILHISLMSKFICHYLQDQGTMPLEETCWVLAAQMWIQMMWAREMNDTWRCLWTCSWARPGRSCCLCKQWAAKIVQPRHESSQFYCRGSERHESVTKTVSTHCTWKKLKQRNLADWATL